MLKIRGFLWKQGQSVYKTVTNRKSNKIIPNKKTNTQTDKKQTSKQTEKKQANKQTNKQIKTYKRYKWADKQ